jgi:mono/diheme cytochrome c family protein
MSTFRALLTATSVALLAACGGGDPSAPDLQARGEELFQGEATCATCHGADVRGTPMGPPLIDRIYAPDHHPDAAFQSAVANGVQPHHWSFGPMPKLTHLDEDDVEAIIAYVRAEQRANGIE